MTRECPIEALVARSLREAGIAFVTEQDPRAKHLDFYLLDDDIHIEVKAMHSDRIALQMARAPNVIAIQGPKAALFFNALCKGYKP